MGVEDDSVLSRQQSLVHESPVMTENSSPEVEASELSISLILEPGASDSRVPGFLVDDGGSRSNAGISASSVQRRLGVSGAASQ